MYVKCIKKIDKLDLFALVLIVFRIISDCLFLKNKEIKLKESSIFGVVTT